MESGLPGNSVFAIQQTKDGYLWIGTQDGLVRFDGFHFETFTSGTIPQLKDNVIRALYEDRNAALWIGTNSGGLTRFIQGEFTTYSIKKHHALARINAINEDQWGNLWIGSLTRGLTCLNLSNGQFTTYTTNDGLPGNQVRSIYKDGNGSLWATTSAGIVKLVKPGVFRVYAPPERLPYFKTACLYKEDTKELWIGTGERSLFRLKNGAFTPYGTGPGILHPTITCLYKDKKKNLWIGTDGGGLTRMSNGVMSTLAGNDGLADGFVYSIYEDREGSLWVGTLDGGLHQLSDSKFTTTTSREGLAHDFIQCIHEGRSGDLWIGTKGGLNRLKRETKGVSAANQVLTNELTASTGLLHNSVISLWEDQAGYLWIGTWGGLHRYKPGTLTSFTKRDGLSDNRITCIMGDRQGNTWVGTEYGLNRYNPGSRQFTSFTREDGLAGNSIKFIFAETRGNLLIGTDAGLNRIKNGAITTYTAGTGGKKSLFHCVYEDKRGTLWFGSNSGLVCWQENETGWSAYTYNVQSGLIENYVYSILEDENGYLWLAGRNGISRVKKSRLEEFSLGKIPRVQPEWYNEKDGMKSRWCTGAACKTPDGRFWFGTSVGVTMIDPHHIKTNPISPSLVIEKIIIDGDTIIIKSFSGGPGGRFYKKASLVAEGKLELAPGKKRLEFHYAAVSFINPEKIRFKLMLEGYDSDWLDMGNVRSATYTGLSPGNYTLKVTAGSSDGVWNEKGAFFSFYMRPFFYQTAWFYVSVIFFVLLAGFSLYRYRVRQLRNRHKELGRQVEIRTGELKERNAELEEARQRIQHTKELIEAKNRQLQEQSEKLKELDKAKSRFFANISHEFRTPLTLIKGPLEQILAENPEQNLETRVNLMLRNSNRLLNLVNQLLDLAKFDSGKMKLQAARQNIVPFVKNIVMCFESLALQNKLDLTFEAEAVEICVYFDPEKIERILTNLLSNAFNYTPAGGKIRVSVREVIGTLHPCGCVEILVRDTGIGIPAERLPHIFDRFYRVETSHEYQQRGTGIGLALVRELIELHHGEIEVHSSCRPDHTRGTEFILRLPMGKAYLQPGEIVNEAVDIKTAREASGPPAKTFADLENDAQIAKESEPGPRTTGGAEKDTILVVEDNADVRAYIRGALEPQFNIEEAANGKEGIDRAGDIIPDLVISDIMMPELDGYEMCARLKKDIKTSHIPVILLTAKASENSIVRGLETGADDYITKPFNANLLVIRVKNLVRLRRQLQRKIQDEMMLQPGEISVSSIDTEFIKEIQASIEENLSGPEFSVEQLAKRLYMSKSSLYKKVEALTGESPQLFIRSYRLKRAAQLLKAKAGNVTEVAFEVGFSSTSYFAKCFKEKFHRLPSDY
jgi:signal transduction histidine kinase/ligand-binding sensor domain-containing protein/DNA-binding response OmpR family regulator